MEDIYKKSRKKTKSSKKKLNALEDLSSPTLPSDVKKIQGLLRSTFIRLLFSVAVQQLSPNTLSVSKYNIRLAGSPKDPGAIGACEKFL